MVDIELSAGEHIIRRIRNEADKAHRFLLLSFHDFSGTPKKGDMMNLLSKMQFLGADICKIAVMANSMADVAGLLGAVQEFQQREEDCLISAVAMGEKGLVSRMYGDIFGSVLTFASGAEASAPGQIPAKDMVAAWEMLTDM